MGRENVVRLRLAVQRRALRSVRTQNHVAFQEEFLSAIRSGQKTQTIRLWKFARMRAGQRSYIPVRLYPHHGRR